MNLFHSDGEDITHQFGDDLTVVHASSSTPASPFDSAESDVGGITVSGDADIVNLAKRMFNQQDSLLEKFGFSALDTVEVIMSEESLEKYPYLYNEEDDPIEAREHYLSLHGKTGILVSIDDLTTSEGVNRHHATIDMSGYNIVVLPIDCIKKFFV